MADRSKTPDLFTPLFECVVEVQQMAMFSQVTVR